jgi:parallel beta-helix repeat protein
LSSDTGSTRRSVLGTFAAGIAGAIVGGGNKLFAQQVANGTPQVARLPIYDVRSFGAKGDGTTVDTSAINRAIEAAAAAGGGTVLVPAGNYLCYTIHLKNNIALYLDQGATIVAGETGPQGQYDPAEPNQWDHYQDYGHSHWHNSLIVGEEIHDFSILGPGLIWGKGLSRGTRQGPRAEDPGVGNKAISLKNCHNVNLRDFSILHGGHFGILATGVDNLTIDNLKIDTNRDGIDVDCCSNVRISNCSVNSPWDDGICLKSSPTALSPAITWREHCSTERASHSRRTREFLAMVESSLELNRMGVSSASRFQTVYAMVATESPWKPWMGPCSRT